MSTQNIVKDLFRMRNGEAIDPFSKMLFDLLSLADASQRAKLKKVFPQEVTTWYAWKNSNSEAAFFKNYGIELLETPKPAPASAPRKGQSQSPARDS